MERNTDEIEGPKMISDAVSCFFYLGNARRIVSWFGFFESSLHTTVHLIFMALFLFGVARFDIYQEFEGKHKFAAVYCAGTPFLLLFLSNLVSKLTFTLSGNGNRDKLLSFLMVDDSSNVVEQNIVHVKYFRRIFSSELLKFRVFIGGFGLFLVLFKVIVDICRLNQQARWFYSLCTIGFWCYMCLSSVIANGFVYMAAIACKLHATTFKNCLNEPGYSTKTLIEHNRRLCKFIEDFGEKYFWYFASQAMICQIAGCMALQIMYFANFMPADLICFIVVEIPMFWSVRRVLKDLVSELETIRTIVAKKREFISLVSANEDVIDLWECADFCVRHNEGVEVFGSTSRILLVTLLPLGIATIATLGKLAGLLPERLLNGIN